ncbi:hypothetical protein ABZ470_26220 [Streptosporangium sp. NPDC020072]|uniref:hypothetical protein n=1 Tax=Streptosporangium sp. NPDC020072 TaxID=3154788 RepID=UPI003442349F
MIPLPGTAAHAQLAAVAAVNRGLQRLKGALQKRGVGAEIVHDGGAPALCVEGLTISCSPQGQYTWRAEDPRRPSEPLGDDVAVIAPRIVARLRRRSVVPQQE